MGKEKVLMSWSGGKDSSMALYRVLQGGEYEVVGLMTTISGKDRRISMHGVRESLLEKQSESIGIPMAKIILGEDRTNEEYERRLEETVVRYRKEYGVTRVIYGDIALEDLKKYREAHYESFGMGLVFPLWGEDTSRLVREYIGLGFKSVICCVSDPYFKEEASGRDITLDFVEGISEGVDPCGENGEYHSFAYGGPIFSFEIGVQRGERRYRDVYHPPEGEDEKKLIEGLKEGSKEGSKEGWESKKKKLPDPHKDLKIKSRGFWFCDLTLVG